MKLSAFGCDNITIIDSPQDQKMIQLIRDARLNFFIQPTALVSS